MNTYFTLEESAKYLKVSVDTIKRYIEKGVLPVYRLDRAIRFLKSDLDNLLDRNMEILLTQGLRASITSTVGIEKWREAWRITLKFFDTSGNTRAVVPYGNGNNKFFEYYIFITKQYLDSNTELPINQQGAETFALQYISNRFNETIDKNGDRNIGDIEENTVICDSNKCTRGKDLTLSSLYEYNGYKVDMLTDGFASLLQFRRLAEVVVFFVHNEESEYNFAFARSHMDKLQSNNYSSEDLIYKMVQIIRERIDDKDLKNKFTYTYEFSYSEFVEVSNPQWWEKDLAKLYAF